MMVVAVMAAVHYAEVVFVVVIKTVTLISGGVRDIVVIAIVYVHNGKRQLWLWW